jgi:chaperonin GroEL (HSP60 family)
VAGIRQLSRLEVADPVANRNQENVRSALNPVLKALQSRTPVTGTKGGNAALASLLSALAAAGIIEDKTT